VPEEPGLDVFRFERFAQQGILKEVNLPNAQIIHGSPVAVHLVEHVGRQRTFGFWRFGGRSTVGGDGSR
jgi:hypothetical protein